MVVKGTDFLDTGEMEEYSSLEKGCRALSNARGADTTSRMFLEGIGTLKTDSNLASQRAGGDP